jgi:hypothetical protein
VRKETVGGSKAMEEKHPQILSRAFQLHEKFIFSFSLSSFGVQSGI